MVEEKGLTADNVILAQGTLRPDLIESGGSAIGATNAAVIKTHHNDTALVRQLRDAGRIIEPLRDYHKDEVRALGMDLGLPEPLVWRQPFPGPGLAIRVLCVDGPYMTPSFDAVSAQLTAACAAWEGPPLSPALLPVRTVGVQGDGRSYSYLAALSMQGSADHIVTEVLVKFGLNRKLAQVPVVLFPIGFGKEGARSIGIRAFLTRDFMTGTPV